MTSADRPGALSGRARFLLPLFLLVLIAASTYRLVLAPELEAPEGAADGDALTELRGATMGTRYSIKLVGRLPAAAQQRARAGVEEVLQRIDRSMSSYRPDSELSRLNAHPGQQPFPVSEDFARVLQIAKEVSDQSRGALDVTVAPLVDAWGFGPGKATRREPEAAELARLRARVGFQHLELGPQGVTKARADVQCDVSAIAKGYAVDRIVDALGQLGHERMLVEVGGELRAVGSRPDGGVWRVAVERPDAPPGSVERVIPLRDMGMATSGDYRNFYELDGRRFAHILDPRSGRPVQHSLASVTVLHKESARADAWATALSVLGADEGLELARQAQLSALFLLREPDGRFRSVYTPPSSPLAGRAKP